MIELEKTSTRMPCTCLTAGVASIRVNCQIYVTSVMINTFITFLLEQSTLPAVIFFICGISLSPMSAYYIRMLSCVVVTNECDVFLVFV